MCEIKSFQQSHVLEIIGIEVMKIKYVLVIIRTQNIITLTGMISYYSFHTENLVWHYLNQLPFVA